MDNKPGITYVPSRVSVDMLENNFKYHKPIGDQYLRYESIRKTAKEFAELLLEYCPSSRELSLAMTNLEQAVMWANASIARNEKDE